MISDDIKASQAAYAARPYAVRWCDSHAALTNRFHTFDEAYQYAQEQWARIRRDVERNRYRESFLWQSWIETPESKITLRYWLLADDVSSYR